MSSVVKMRTAQRRFMRMVDQHRLLGFLARRQYGKTTTFAQVALKKMMKTKDHTVIFGSAKLNLSREIVRKEAGIMQKAIERLARDAAEAKGMVTVVDAMTGKAPDHLSADDFAGIFEAQRLEFRYYHSRSSYSRTKVVALLPDTVGETGDLMADEVGRVKNWREVWEAIEPIVQSNPEFRLLLSTTPPPDDSHFSFDMLSWPVGTEFTPNAEGNVYRSEMGVMVLRVDAWDAYADGIPVYDLEDGQPLAPDEHRRRAYDKDAWDRNYGVKFILGGAAACGLMQLDTAQRRGIGKCALFPVENDMDLDRALCFLRGTLGDGAVGLGYDTATTTKEKSNPSSVTVGELKGVDFAARSVIVWKTKDPNVAKDYLRRIVLAVKDRPVGGPARGLAVDATNERYFAADVRDELGELLPVTLVVGSEGFKQPGEEPMTMKQYLGSRLIAELEDNHLTLPPERYLRDDWRLVKKEKGQLICDPDVDGKHGDTFDSTKLAFHAVTNTNADFFVPRAFNSRSGQALRERRNREVLV